LFLICGFFLVERSVVDRLTLGSTYEHWSRYMVMSFLFFLSAIIFIARGLNFILDLINERHQYLVQLRKK